MINNKLVKRAVAALAVKELVERVQDARRPKRSFLRRHIGKLALVSLAGAGFYAYQQRSGQISLPGSGSSAGGSFGSREPSIEPDERIDSPLLAPGATQESPTPEPAR